MRWLRQSGDDSDRLGRQTSVPGAALAALSLIALGLIGCAPPTTPAGSNDGGISVTTPGAAANAPVDVALVDTAGTNGPMALAPFVASATAGDVTFRVRNLGTIEH